MTAREREGERHTGTEGGRERGKRGEGGERGEKGKTDVDEEFAGLLVKHHSQCKSAIPSLRKTINTCRNFLYFCFNSFSVLGCFNRCYKIITPL